MALVRVYCGLASADETVRAASAPQLTIAVVDDAGRLLGVHEISDDPGGYAELGALLVERTSGFSDAAVAADSDDHLVTSLLTAAGRPLAVSDDDTTDDFAERFADDDSVEEMRSPPAARRAVGLARALQAGAVVAVNQPVPRDLISYKPVLAAHVALLGGRQATATALREVLRELYPAALRAYPNPAHPLALAVLDALPEPGRLTVHGSSSEQIAEQVAAELIRSGAGTDDEIIAAVTALHVAISESPRRGGVNKSLAPAAADTVRKAITAVRACEAACSSLIGTISDRSGPATAGSRARRRPAEPALQPVQAADPGRSTRRGGRRDPMSTGSGPVLPQPLTAPPVAPDPIGPPPLAPRPVTPPVAPAAAAFAHLASAPGNRPVSLPPPPPGMTPITPGMTPITPGSRPVPGTRRPAAPDPAPLSSAASLPLSGSPTSLPPGSPAFLPPSGSPTSLPPTGSPTSLPPSVSPADSGQPFRATLTNAVINNARTERQRTVIPPRPNRSPSASAPGSATDYTPPMPAHRPMPEVADPGSRANWPLADNDEETVISPAVPISAPPVDTGRVKPPWQDMPKEPPSLRLVEAQLRNSMDTTVPDLPAVVDPPPLRLIEGDDRGSRRLPRRGNSPTSGTTLTALDRSTAPPVPSDSSDGDLLIFAAARSAWFTGHSETPASLDWANPNDTGWQAAERAATPEVMAETAAGLPKRVPQANLVPGSPLRDERPLRIVRDAASIAAHTTGYFRGWRRGQEIGGFAMGGRPGRESAGGWDFSRDGQGNDDYRNSAGYGSR